MEQSFLVYSTEIVTYTADDMCGRPASIPIQPFFRFKLQKVHFPHLKRDPGLIHHVTLKNLQPATTYYYRVRTSNGPYSEVYSFTTRGKHVHVDFDLTKKIPTSPLLQLLILEIWE